MRPALLATLTLALLAVTLVGRPARAWDVEIESETIGQGYQLMGADGSFISRRRLDQYLGLSIWNLGPKDEHGLPLPRNQFYFTSSMRIEFDLGDYAQTTWGGRDVSKELADQQLQILYAYVGARDLGGFLDLKLGRQIDSDLFEFLAYDGLWLEAKTPWYFAVSAYGGLLVNGYLPVDSTIFRPDGTAPGFLSAHDSDPKPVVGVSIHTFGFRDLDGRLSFRQVFSPAASGPCTAANDIANVERCAGVGSGVSEQTLGYTLRGRLLGGLLVPWAGFRYNFLVGAFDNIQGGVRLTLSPHHALQLEYLYSYPTFDGDSIWNLFVRNRFDDARLGYDLRLGRLRAWANGFARFFRDTPENIDRLGGLPPRSPGLGLAYGGDFGVRYDFAHGYLRADAYAQLGYGGKNLGGDVATRWQVWRDRVSLEGRLLYAHFEDDLRPDVSRADSFGVQAGARVQLFPGLLLHLLAEDNVNRYYTSQLRFFAMLDVSTLFGSQGVRFGQANGIGPLAGQFGSSYGLGRGY